MPDLWQHRSGSAQQGAQVREALRRPLTEPERQGGRTQAE
ncbi:TIGR03751 family conjugal transfer lipoprotein, partial [Salmonella enterica subsp. enterica serovar Poona]|nr:TIGR03751 family conjugal transfer lipoprotein [Salmonella enterica subsp. enterica serovar Poona]